VPDVRYLPVEFQDGDWIRDRLYISANEWKKIKTSDDPGERLRIANRLDEYRRTKSTSIWDDLHLAPDGQRGYLIPKHASPDSYTRDDVFTQSMARDHVLPLAKHWTDAGYNQTDAQRAPVGRGTGGYKLELVSADYNNRKQALGAKYRFDVHAGFSSEDNESPVKGWRIGGRPFLRTRTGPSLLEPTD
jgi:hypothetical protein